MPGRFTEPQAAVLIGHIHNGKLPPARIKHCDQTLFKDDKRLIDVFFAIRAIAFSRQVFTITTDNVLEYLKNESWLRGNKERMEEYRQLLARLQAIATNTEPNGETIPTK